MTEIGISFPHHHVSIEDAEERENLTDEPASNPTFYHNVLSLPEREHDSFEKIWNRFQGKGRRKVGWLSSAKAIATSSWLNFLLPVIPVAWVSHFLEWHYTATFALCFIAIVPLERLFEFGGEQMSFYVGRQLGDLITISLNNAVEASLAIILLHKCELKMLQSTIIGVILLHLLLIPGTAFLTEGAHIWEQLLNPHLTQLNHTLLTIGVLALLLPAAFFAALRDSTAVNSEAGITFLTNSDGQRHFLEMSRGIAIILLVVYVCSRIYLINPPGKHSALILHPSAPDELRIEEEQLANEDPDVNPWACIILLLFIVGITAATAEWLVDSIEPVREAGNIEESWFGLILLPVVSFSADGVIAVGYFIRSILHRYLGTRAPPTTLAKARAIDLSIQFSLFWMPFLVLLGWWTDKPLTLLFDFFELSVLLGATFLVNYVTADHKTNFAEGSMMVAFYIMIALCTWFYPGQPEIEAFTICSGSTTAG